jgi:aminodeoxyfutalosine synthase
MTAPTLEDLQQRLAAGEPFTDADAAAVLALHDLVGLGMLAGEARQRQTGPLVTYVRVVEHGAGDPVPEAWPAGAGEIRLTGRPRSAEAAIAKAWAAVERAGAVPVTAWDLADLVALAGDDEGLASLGRGLREAGVHAVAEAAIDRVDPLAIHRLLDVGLGVQVAAFSELPRQPVAALRRIHDLQRATGALRAVAPLPRRSLGETPSTGYDDVRLVAAARLLLDNVVHVQVDWAVHGPKLAQVALLFGASDFDRVPAGDDAPLGPRRAPLEEVRRNITTASLTPAERNGRFERTGG